MDPKQSGGWKIAGGHWSNSTNWCCNSSVRHGWVLALSIQSCAVRDSTYKLVTCMQKQGKFGSWAVAGGYVQECCCSSVWDPVLGYVVGKSTRTPWQTAVTWITWLWVSQGFQPQIIEVPMSRKYPRPGTFADAEGLHGRSWLALLNRHSQQESLCSRLGWLHRQPIREGNDLRRPSCLRLDKSTEWRQPCLYMGTLPGHRVSIYNLSGTSKEAASKEH